MDVSVPTINGVPARASVECAEMHMYRFDQPMRRVDAQAASALGKVILELSDVIIYGRFNVVDACCHGGKQKWT